MHKFWVIAGDVYKKNIKSAGFLILILAPFLMGAFYYVIGQFAATTSVDQIGVYSQDDQLTQAFTQNQIGDYHFKEMKSEAAAQKALNDDDIDAYLVLTTTGDEVAGSLYAKSSVGTATEMTIQQVLTQVQSGQRAETLGLDSATVASLNAPAKLATQKVTFDDQGKLTTEDDHSSVQMIVTNVCAVILFVFIITYANIIAQEIASEKGTRIMEVILSSTKAQTHYYGKLTGVLLVALTQMLIYGIMVAVGLPYLTKMEIVKQFLGNTTIEKLFGTFALFAVLFVLVGILLYAVLAALCGSLVNKAEDTAKAIIPVTYLAMGAYFISLFVGMFDPNNIAIRVSSYVPFFSSFAMPVRLANDTATVGSAIVSLVILIVTTVILMLVSASLYKSNVLIYNENGLIASLKQSFTLMVNERKKA